MGMSIAANRHKNIRAAQCFNLKSTKLSRLHNDANIITLGSRLLSKNNAVKCVGIFLSTKFDGGRHAKRIKKI
jgi:ribose 5-phosphate isomerase B